MKNNNSTSNRFEYNATEEFKLQEEISLQTKCENSFKRKISDFEDSNFAVNSSKLSVINNDFRQKLMMEHELHSPIKKSKLTMPNNNSKINDSILKENETFLKDKNMITNCGQSISVINASSLKSANAANNIIPIQSKSLPKNLRGISGDANPANSEQKRNIDLNDMIYREPFKLGWKREVVYRTNDADNAKIKADIYYHTPKEIKTRSFREVAEHIRSSQLTIKNFTFLKVPIGLNDQDKEIIRTAKKRKGASVKTSKQTHKKSVKTLLVKKIPKSIEKYTSTTSSVNIASPSTKASVKKKSNLNLLLLQYKKLKQSYLGTSLHIKETNFYQLKLKN